jgi:hypothetical protein
MKLLSTNTARPRADVLFVLGATLSVVVLIAFVMCLHAF